MTDTIVSIQSILQPVVEVVFSVAGVMFVRYMPRLFNNIDAHLGIKLTDQQKSTINDGAKVAGGIIETMIDQGIMKVNQVHITNPTIRDKAQEIIAAAPKAALDLGLSVNSVASMIVSQVDTGSRTPVDTAPIVVPVPVPAAPVHAPAPLVSVPGAPLSTDPKVTATAVVSPNPVTTLKV